ncbi:hypothetical protein SPB21_35180 [Leptothoe sp. ISB3NOV94-8A]
MSLIDDLVPFVGTSAKIVTFFSGGSFGAALDAVSGVHASAAKDVMRKIDFSANPREAVNRVLTHLEAAHVAFYRIWNSPISSAVLPVRVYYAAKKDMEVCCLMAMCHKFLGDDNRIIMQALSDARKPIDYGLERMGEGDRLNVRTFFDVFFLYPITFPSLLIRGFREGDEGAALNPPLLKESLDKFSNEIEGSDSVHWDV